MEELILVVEDSMTQALILEHTLQSRGFRVTLAADGQEAKEWLESHQPNLVISDIVMPHLNGYELCRLIKSKNATSHIPVILLTALADSSEIIEGLACGADSFITKPYQESFLLSTIHRLLSDIPITESNAGADGIHFPFEGKQRTIQADKSQVNKLLISVYEGAILRNAELLKAKEELQHLNDNLESLVEKRTSELVAEIESVKNITEVLQERESELRQLNATKDKFFSIISHDLRSPLSGILGLSDVMVEETDELTSVQLKEFAFSINAAAEKLYRLLNNLLEWSQIQSNTIPFHPKLINILPVISESVQLLHEMANKKEIAIKIDVADDQSAFADTNILQSIIRNLVSNALKYTNKGGLVRIAARTSEDNMAEISVEDSGIGMDQSIVESLFRIEMKSSREGTEGEASTGLGLILCKEFVEKHGGKIWVNSVEGKGSIFSFTVPLSDPGLHI